MTDQPLREYGVRAKRADAHGSVANFKEAELLLAACMVKGIERVTPILRFQLRGVDIAVHG